jgi:enoyl-CoA hydratase/carnithine racemase
MQNNEPEILYNELPAKHGKLGIITLNRPKALNALSVSMVASMYNQLHTWANDNEIAAVIIQGAGDRAFCAGGDLKLVYKHGKDRFRDMVPFFTTEYRLNLYISEYPKPYIALLNGIAMGGGLGVSVHGTRVIATERLQLAMPETAIGFYPDVGAGYFFSRCPHRIGMYLGLTGNSIGVADAMFCKLVHAYVPSDKLPDLVTALTEQDLKSNTLDTIDAVIASFQQEPETPPLKQYINTIENCFNKNSVENIILALEAHHSDWAKTQASILKKRSPTGLKVTFKDLSVCAGLSLPECLNIDLNLTLRLFQEHDIYEGIRAVLVDKTQDPKWQPDTLQGVSDAFIDELFEIKCKL